MLTCFVKYRTLWKDQIWLIQKCLMLSLISKRIKSRDRLNKYLYVHIYSCIIHKSKGRNHPNVHQEMKGLTKCGVYMNIIQLKKEGNSRILTFSCFHARVPQVYICAEQGFLCVRGRGKDLSLCCHSSGVTVKEILILVTTWMKFEDIMLRETHKTQKDKYCVIPLSHST